MGAAESVEEERADLGVNRPVISVCAGEEFRRGSGVSRMDSVWGWFGQGVPTD